MTIFPYLVPVFVSSIIVAVYFEAKSLFNTKKFPSDDESSHSKMTADARELKLGVPWGHVAGLSWGDPKGKPILFVHGTLDNAGCFTRLIKILPKTYHCVAIDLPSHGLSSHFPEGLFLDFFNFVITIHYVLEELQWEKCLYVGHSFGAQLGIMFSIFEPNRLEKIIAIDAFFSKAWKPDQIPGRLQYIYDDIIKSTQKREPPLYTKEKVLEMLQTGRQFVLNKEAAEALFPRGTSRVGDKYKFTRDIRMRPIVTLYFTFEYYLEFSKQLTTPILLIIAEDSWYELARQEKALEMVKNNLSSVVNIIKVEGNHDVHNNNPERIAPQVLSFFNEQRSKL